MLQVAEHLSRQANKEKISIDADAFARSAFNRYYYATYLSVRELLAQLNQDWASQPHKGIPELMEKSIPRLVKKQAKNLLGKGLINDSQSHFYSKQAAQAGSEIASILRIAYGVRIVADYEPSQMVEFKAEAFELADHTCHEAENWKSRVDKPKGILLKLSGELGLV